MAQQPEFELFGPDFEANPYPTYAAMQQCAPVYWQAWPNGGGAWIVTRYEDVAAILRDHKRFVKSYRNALTPEQRAEMAPVPELIQMIDNHLLSHDPPDHTRLRNLVGKAFTSRMVNQMQPRIEAIADQLLDQVGPQGYMDLIEDYAFPLPIIVIAELLGLPVEDRRQLREWSKAFIAPVQNEADYELFKTKMLAFTDYLGKLFRERRREPRQDLITAMVQAEEAGDKLSEAELFSMVILLIVAGHETTVNLIGTGMLSLLRQPDQLARLKQAPFLIDEAIEELLRYDGPVETSTPRWAAEDVEIGGQLIRRGQQVEVVIAAANRDPAQFAQPDRLDITRQDNRHLGFGLGIHYCLGAPLARMEGKIALTKLLQRLPKLGLAAPVETLQWQRLPPVRGLRSLLVRWGE
jgi:cytochrome P450 PksS